MAKFFALILVVVVALAICQFASIDPVVAIKSVLPMLGVGMALSSKKDTFVMYSDREDGFVGVILAIGLLVVAVLFLAAMGNNQSGTVTAGDVVHFLTGK